MLDLVSIRKQFPSLERTLERHPVVYFDGPGGTQIPRQVMDAVAHYYLSMNCNIEGTFVTSEDTDRMLVEADRAMVDFLNARSPDEIAFGLNMTTHAYNVSRAIGKTLQPGDELVVTVLDHEANVSPWQALEERGVKVHRVDIHPEDCTLDMEDLESKLTSRTKVVAIGYASNAVGTVNPVSEVIEKAHQVGALVFVDAVHYAPHGPIDVQALDCDLMVLSVYKFFGPHLGVLYGKQGVLERLPAYKIRPAKPRFEIGTQNHEGIAGSLAAVDYLAELGRRQGGAFRDRFPQLEGRRLHLKTCLSAIESYERPLFQRLLDGLEQIKGLKIWGITDRERLHCRTPTAAFTVPGRSPREITAEMGKKGFFLWEGDFYAQALIERLGLHDSGGVVRLGLVHYNTAEEVDRCLSALEALVRGRA